jgi:hypothetical protein
MTDMIPHTSEDHYPDIEDIYRIFNSIDFSQDAEDFEMYQNILKSSIHIIASRPQLFPYNKIAQWCLKKFDVSMKSIMRKKKTKLASLRPEDISSIYHLPTPTFSLNEHFLKGFTQERKGPKK